MGWGPFSKAVSTGVLATLCNPQDLATGTCHHVLWVTRGKTRTCSGGERKEVSGSPRSGFPQLLLLSLTPEPRPSLSLSPSHEVALRDRVTLQCHVAGHNGRATLHKEGVPHPLRYRDVVQGAAEFPIPAARREDAGRYWCRHETKGGRSEESERVELVFRHLGSDPCSRRTLGCISSGVT
uniref:Ig-like domain-containing protein n=1 Tax=Nothoprocta perdicaria TaxID=30464 RepID=A0A8C7EHW7_NOTPE